MRISSNVYKVPGVSGCNCYVWIDRSVTIIDTGLPGNARVILEFVESVAPGKRIATIALTHSDIDHIGSAVRLRGLTGARIAIHELDAPAVLGERWLKEVSYLVSLLVQSFSFLLGYRPFKPDVLLKDKDRIDGLVVIHAPGHSRGSIALYKPGALIFTGDAVMTDRKGALMKVRSFITSSVQKTRESTARIAKLDFGILCPGHGHVILHDASQKLREYVRLK